MWRRVGHCEHWRCGERFWHAGLSEDGAKCFVAEFDDNVYSVWDIDNSDVVWRDDGTDDDSPLATLSELIDPNGIVDIHEGPAMGRYRLFGLEHNYAKTKSPILDQELEVDVKRETLLVRSCSSGDTVCELKYEVFSGDWAFASFSENDKTIAVVEPYNVTFFRRPIK